MYVIVKELVRARQDQLAVDARRTRQGVAGSGRQGPRRAIVRRAAPLAAVRPRRAAGACA